MIYSCVCKCLQLHFCDRTQSCVQKTQLQVQPNKKIFRGPIAAKKCGYRSLSLSLSLYIYIYIYIKYNIQPNKINFFLRRTYSRIFKNTAIGSTQKKKKKKGWANPPPTTFAPYHSIQNITFLSLASHTFFVLLFFSFSLNTTTHSSSPSLSHWYTPHHHVLHYSSMDHQKTSQEKLRLTHLCYLR